MAVETMFLANFVEKLCSAVVERNSVVWGESWKEREYIEWFELKSPADKLISMGVFYKLTWNSGGGSIGANGTTFFKVLKFSALIPPSEQFSNESNWETSASLSAANWKKMNKWDRVEHYYSQFVEWHTCSSIE